ncbi:hypothetical protein F5B17DRAFT_60138 [Nemania serpens]|nr:hypothetical protein F5B17DRAFT_60138 [Nemania serpens]
MRAPRRLSERKGCVAYEPGVLGYSRMSGSYSSSASASASCTSRSRTIIYSLRLLAAVSLGLHISLPFPFPALCVYVHTITHQSIFNPLGSATNLWPLVVCTAQDKALRLYCTTSFFYIFNLITVATGYRIGSPIERTSKLLARI